MDDNVVTMEGKPVKPEMQADYKTALAQPLDLTPQQPPAPPPEPGPVRRVLLKLRRRLRTTRKFLWERLLRPLRDVYYRAAGDRALSKLVLRARQLNRDDFHVHLTISGHVESFQMEFHPGGWHKDKCHTIGLPSVYCPGHSSLSKASPRDIEDMIVLVETFSRLNHLYRRR